MSTSVKGLPSLIRKLQAIEQKMGRGCADGLKRAGDYLLTKSQEICPVDDDVLRQSGFCESQGSGFDTVVVVGYTDEVAPEVHEDLEALHGENYNAHYSKQIREGRMYMHRGRLKPYHNRRPQEQAKFLEQPVRTEIDVCQGIIFNAAQKAFR
jgi:hypothetical protein